MFSQHVENNLIWQVRLTELFIDVAPQGVTKLTISDIKLDLTADFKTLYFILVIIMHEE